MKSMSIKNMPFVISIYKTGLQRDQESFEYLFTFKCVSDQEFIDKRGKRTPALCKTP